MREIIKSVIERIPSSVFERLLGLSLFNENFSAIRVLPKYQKREDLWKDVIDKFNGNRITVLEFGVWQGYSIKKFAELNTNENSEFFGFDSFLGLPEDWVSGHPKGTFNEDGNLPKFADNRIRFVKGWFQNTLTSFIKENKIDENLLVHYDADIFSATLFAMLEIDKLKIPYYAVFDEFIGHETRALHRYMQISGAEIELIASTGNKRYPIQVSCLIKPAKVFDV